MPLAVHDFAISSVELYYIFTIISLNLVLIWSWPFLVSIDSCQSFLYLNAHDLTLLCYTCSSSLAFIECNRIIDVKTEEGTRGKATAWSLLF